ncbi:MAG: hypothetical protein E6J91_21980, partial [Deltaproteobacteria bacterium]
RNRYALVNGSETEGLAGAIHDAGCMATVLAKNYGYTVESRIGGDATRDGILDGYNRLIGRVAGGDAAVVYYAGHGSFSFNRDPDDPIRTVQAIIPVDHKRGAPNFQAITAWELGILLQKLTDRTQNVTVILDCCHSSQMSRDAAARQAVPRSLPHPLRTSFREHLTALEKLYGDVELDPVGNPHAVRLVACAQTESAWEYANADGKRTGVFTEALIEVLTEIGNAAISWAAVGNAVRERVLKHFEHQRPDVEGPSERQLFTLTPDRRTGAVPVTMTGGELVIHTGEVLGTARGDTYAAMPLGSESYDATKVIAELKVLEVAPLMSTVTAAWKNGHGHLPDDAVAIPVALAAPTHPVVVIAPDTEREAIAAALRVARTLGIATAEEAGTAIAILRLADAQLVIEDPAGPIFPPARYPQDLADAVKNLANLGVARRVRDMVGEHGLSGAGLDISWGVVQSGQEQPMPDHGASLGLHDRIYVKVKNTTGDPRYIHIFNVGVRARARSAQRQARRSPARLAHGATRDLPADRFAVRVRHDHAGRPAPARDPGLRRARRAARARLQAARPARAGPGRLATRSDPRDRRGAAGRLLRPAPVVSASSPQGGDRRHRDLPGRRESTGPRQRAQRRCLAIDRRGAARHGARARDPGARGDLDPDRRARRRAQPRDVLRRRPHRRPGLHAIGESARGLRRAYHAVPGHPGRPAPAAPARADLPRPRARLRRHLPVPAAPAASRSATPPPRCSPPPRSPPRPGSPPSAPAPRSVASPTT